MHPDTPPKLPKNYRLVYDVVLAQPPGQHAAAGDIYAEARRRQAGLGHSTVYRALERLRDLGLVHEVKVPGTASALYEPSRHGHAHFLCTACGRVEDVDYDIPTADIVALNKANNITISDVALTFNGLCQACAKP
ncbi:transcriptional repressor [Lichenihabitans sp. PAMC28606]|uniref:Fur family transcriptional regulator n=1 Tax=Lichenihabitans sp. PAMC28606 TaxID=2880932 RepID=UPI001D0A4F15|nr:Fur family transcriptional regulator [Lichenihabitans sp. PAMC28606]UDL94669.1 transcriptional repressor [Lichenihabitans sp. PAMC28606]